LKRNLILICIDGGRVDRAKNSSIIQNFRKENSIFFSQSITYAPYTNSALHALVSGVYGNRTGCYSYWHSHKFNHNKFKTIIDYLHDNNYYTCVDVPSDLIMPRRNYDEYYVSDESSIDLRTHHSELLCKMKKLVDSEQNFFLHLHYSGIHEGIRDTVLKSFTNYSNEFFENRKQNEERYDALFLDAEKYLEHIHDKLDELNLWENSIIIIFSDHGISLGEKFGERAYGALCYDSTINTFYSYFSSDLKHKEITSQVRSVDFMPTILEHLGIKLDRDFEQLDGVSLFPLINDQNPKENFAYTETGNPLNSNIPPKKPNTKSIRTSEWKLIVNEHNNTKELYNLKEDSLEENNLINTGLEIESVLWKEFLKIQERSVIN
jgi:arylsulfatase A-like enzyme